jgi:LPXTG-site transpeptidase (sortase) family protein
VKSSGIDLRHGALGIPVNIRRTGWWRDGMAPGARTGAVLIAGHRDSAKAGAGVFFPLGKAAAGDRVLVDSAAGKTFAYRVVSVRAYRKAALPTSIYARTGKPRLVLVTCGGPFDEKTGHYRDDVVVTAVPA